MTREALHPSFASKAQSDLGILQGYKTAIPRDRQYVSWDEKDRIIEVVRECKTCFPDGFPKHNTLVSPQGLAHHGNETSEETECGHVCTGPEWWHRL